MTGQRRQEGRLPIPARETDRERGEEGPQGEEDVKKTRRRNTGFTTSQAERATMRTHMDRASQGKTR